MPRIADLCMPNKLLSSFARPVRKTLSSSANRLRFFLMAPVLAGMQANDRKYSSRLNQIERSIAEIERSLNEIDQAILTSAMERLYPPKHKIIAEADGLDDIPNKV
jgi:hypothetical protein